MANETLGGFFRLYAGNTGRHGVITANGATPVVVANRYITADSVVVFTLKTVGGTVGAYPTIATITPGTGFNFVATAGDTSQYNFIVIK